MHMDNTAQMKWTAFLIDQNKHMTYLLLGNIRRSQMKRIGILVATKIKFPLFILKILPDK